MRALANLLWYIALAAFGWGVVLGLAWALRG